MLPMTNRTAPRPFLPSPLTTVAIALLVAIVTLMACAAPAGAAAAGTAPERASLPRLSTAPTVRIGFFANLTHAPALVAQNLRLFETVLGKDGTKVEYVLFNAGPAAVEAMKGHAIDVAFIGPSPAISGFSTTNGSLLRIVSGVTSGGAQLVVNSKIHKASDFKGKKLTTPQLGNTQDVALRSWLQDNGLSSNVSGGGDVQIFPTENSTTMQLFRRGDIDGAWLPEPWASRLVQEAGAHVYLDERSLWPRGQFVTTNLIASQEFLDSYPGTVRSIIQANNSAISYIKKNPVQAKRVAQKVIEKWTGKPLPAAAIARAWGNMSFTYDPLASTLKKNADDAVGVGLLKLPSTGLAGIYDLRLLNSLLGVSGSPAVSPAGLGAA